MSVVEARLPRSDHEFYATVESSLDSLGGKKLGRRPVYDNEDDFLSVLLHDVEYCFVLTEINARRGVTSVVMGKYHAEVAQRIVREYETIGLENPNVKPLK